ncbi:SDR family NAD(P)-dependent oxidoreductase [Pseudoalteromonas sp. SMS1]|uniref:type I polyketide synthase n=1 Tax=Pseudoalteromonas sp. SMS1 TaxID=2908894 RepID=UPI001F23BF15|nr:type I polyketide synthase [Pseudoalteromonas sp. SMS1]MCF2858936.1 SDR family NAD(P)-dependent oxidoreductase [Pseudoalteromonas sp. SMS1]
MSKEPIAIIGLSSLYPGATNLKEYWDNILIGKDCITDIPDTHWNIEDYFDDDPMAEDRTYCKRGGFIPETDFNPVEFGIPPNILEVTDVLQLLSLNVAKAAFHDAGYLADDIDHSRTGVILGITGATSLQHSLAQRLDYPIWREVLTSKGLSEEEADQLIKTANTAHAPWEENSFPGLLGNVVAGRIANRFNLGATNCTVDAACASSLGALRMAMDELQMGRADLMLTGGCDSENSILTFMCFSKTPAFSKENKIRPFDQHSDGTLIGEGMGMIALKRLSDAQRDGDRIYAVISGLGSASDGRFKSIYAPRASGQALCLRRAYEDAQCEPNDVSLIEAHGTGTPVGDATEFSALKEVFTEGNGQHIALGSVKSQIGHTKAAAGAASLIKVALALHHKVLPPTNNITAPHDNLDIEQSNFYLNCTTRPWFKHPEQDKLRAGVSSFGFGGTNFHAVVEQYETSQPAQRLNNMPHACVISAASHEQLIALAEQLKDIDSVSDIPFMSAPAEAPRAGFVCQSLPEFKAQLDVLIKQLNATPADSAWQLPQGLYFAPNSAVTENTKVAALFPGQGSQYVDMGLHQTMNVPQARTLFELANETLWSHSNTVLTDLVYPFAKFSEQAKQADLANLKQTQHAQPAIGCVSAGAFAFLKSCGFTPDCVAGHSYGELTALWSANVYDDDAFVSLSVKRGLSMSEKPEGMQSGDMYAIGMSQSDVAQLISEEQLSDVYICNINTQQQTVIGGHPEPLAKFATLCEQREQQITKLDVSDAFHTPYVAHAIDKFSSHIEDVNFAKASCPVYLNEAGDAHIEASDIKQSLKGQLGRPVQFLSIIENMYEDGVRVFVECGPKGTLSAMAKRILAQHDDVIYIKTDGGKGKSSDVALLSSLVQLAVAGVAVTTPGLPIRAFKPAESKGGFTMPFSGVNYQDPTRLNDYQAGLEEIANSAIGQQQTQPSIMDTSAGQSQSDTANKPDEAKASAPVDAIPTHTVGVLVEQNIPHTTPEPVMSAQQADQVALEVLGKAMSDNTELHKTYLKYIDDNARSTTELVGRVLTSTSEQPAVADAMIQLTQKAFDLIEKGQDETAFAHRVFLDGAVHQDRPVKDVLSSGRETHVAPQPLPTNQHSVTEVSPEAQPQQQVSAKQTVEPIVSASTHPREDATPPVKTAPKVSAEVVETQVMTIIADKTGYPIGVLDAQMSLESDLGIDSIKRVEILGAVQEALPELTNLQAHASAQINTIGDLQAVIMSALQSPSAASMDTASATPDTAAIPQVDIEPLLLKVVSEKTGYPLDVLSLDMHMESELGIDSIKRVEILGAIQEQYSDLPTFNAEDLTALDTLQEIKSYFEKLANNGRADSVVDNTESVSTAIDLKAVSAEILSIVSEKTGYPKDVISPTMAFESDLGIDSIKRVEILGAVQSAFENLPALDTTELNSLDTIGDLQAYIEKALSGGGSAATVDSHPAPHTAFDVVEFEQILLKIVGDKTGYPADVLNLDMDLEADLGIDSIKRVEIFGAMQQSLGQDIALPADELSALASLRDIVDYVVSQIATPSSGTKAHDSHDQSEGKTHTFEVNNQAKVCEYDVQLSAIPPVDESQVFSKGSKVLLVSEGSGRTIKLFEALQARELSVTLLRYPEVADLEIDADVIDVQWAQSPKEIVAHFETFNAYVLQTLPSTHTMLSPASADEQFNWLSQHLLFAKDVVSRDVNSATERVAFVCVSYEDGQLGLSQPEQGLYSAGVNGLVKTLAHENSLIFCKAIDVDGAIDSAYAAEYVVAELHDYSNKYKEISYNAAGRHTVTFSEAVHGDTTHTNQAEHVIVTGGARGVTATCIKTLAKANQSHYHLLGRSALLPSDPDWAQGLNEAALNEGAMTFLQSGKDKVTPKAIRTLVREVTNSREIRETLEAIRETGSKADYHSVDVNHLESVTRWADAQSWLHKSTPIALVHGAGALADKLLKDKTVADVQHVFAPKIFGLVNLLSVLDLSALERVVLFSSVAGLYGNPGQSDYAMANEILNRFAVLLNAQLKAHNADASATSIVWGAWDSGMVDANLKKMFEQRGVALIEESHGAEVFSKVFTVPTSPVFFFGPNRGLAGSDNIASMFKHGTWSVKRNLQSIASNRLLADHSIDGHIVLPTTFSLGMVFNIIEGLFPGLSAVACEQHQVKKGIVADDKFKPELEFVVNKSAQWREDNLVVDVVVKNTANDQVHYVCNGVKLIDGDLMPMVERASNAEINRTMQPIYDDKILFHESRFQLLKAFEQTGDQALEFSCESDLISDMVLEQHATSKLCPLYLDGAIQAAAYVIYHLDDVVNLPTEVSQVTLYRRPKFAERIIIKAALVKPSDFTPTLSIMGQTETGEVLFSLDGTFIKNNALLEKFRAQPAQVD